MSDLLSALGIFLAIITLFYEKTSTTIKPLLEKDIPPIERKIEREKTKRAIEKTIWSVVLFVLIYFVFFWLLLPTSIEIISRSSFSIWGFDVIDTIYIIVNCTAFVFLIAAIKNLILLIGRRKKCLTTAST
jgi:hypothetical protein